MPFIRKNVNQSPTKGKTVQKKGATIQGEDQSSSTKPDGNGKSEEAVSRRSGRQRTVSKWLQDMQLDFGTKKSSAPKRQRDGNTTDNPKSLKKLKSTPIDISYEAKEAPVVESSSTPTDGANGKESNKVHTLRMAGAMISQAPVVVESSSTPADGAKGKESNKVLTIRVDGAIISVPEQDELSLFVPSTESSHESIETDDVSKPDESSYENIHSISSNTKENHEVDSKALENTENLEHVTPNKLNAVDSSKEEEKGDEVQSVTLNPVPNDGDVCQDSPDLNLKMQCDSIDCQESPDTEFSKLCPDASDDAGNKSEDRPPLSESGSHSPRDQNINLSQEAPLTEISSKKEQQGNGEVADDNNEEADETDQIEGKEITWIQLETCNDPEDESPTSNSQDGVSVDCDGEKGGEENSELFEQNDTLKEVQHQVVILDDGRQLILSNPDALATAANVATIGQLKEITYVISDATNEPQDDTVRGEEKKGESIENGVEKDIGIKIKFVNLETGDQNEKSVSALVPQQSLNMRQAPPTVLSQDGFYRCTLCSYKTEKKANWYKHRYTHIGQRRYQCDQCSYKATSSSNLKRHALIHSDKRFFQCDLCSSQFRQKIHLERHMKYKHEEKNVKCDYCDYVCSNVNPDLKVHMKRRHILQCGDENERLQFRCETCGFIAACNRDLKQHQKFHRAGPELKLYCEYCSFVTDCASRLNRHLLVHSKERPFQCKLCNYRASQKEHIVRHFRSKHKDASIEEAPDFFSDLDLQEGSNPPVSSESGTQNTSEDPEDIDNKMVTGDESILSSDSILESANNTHSDQTPSKKSELGKEGESGMSPSETSQNSPTSFHQALRRKKYKPADFSAREKVFTCIHCTMKFAKLINLYKHLAVQHKDVHTSRKDGLHSCVWCEYQTNKWKNLLVHMRKHNYREGESGSQNVYNCVVCSYSNPRRRTLYAHMMKKHKIHIYVKPDGTTNCLVDDTVPGTMMASPDGSKVVVQPPPSAASHPYIQGIPSVLKHEEKTERTQMVMIELEPGMPATAVEISAPKHSGGYDTGNSTDNVDHEAVDAIEGLQALAEQVIAVEQEQEIVETHEVSGDIVEDNSVEESKIELSAEQLLQLSSGDFIEINGEMYKVEVAEDVQGASN